MATNYVQEGDTLTLTAPYTRTAGQGALVGSIFGVALNDVTSAAEGEFCTEGVWDISAESADTFSQGDPVYWDDSAKKCTSSSTSNTLIGAATAAKAGAETTVRVKLGAGV